MIGRREFISLLGGAAATWPIAARAQADRMRRVSVLVGGTTANDPELPDRIAAFLQGMRQLGWTDGRNIRIDIREGAGNPDTIRKYAAEFAALAPDVIFTTGASLATLLQATRTVPIVFALVQDPSAPASSIAWRSRAATRPGSCSSNTI
jgi:putative tryptophan/tyrosine transport system substrate-binding protein